MYQTVSGEPVWKSFKLPKLQAVLNRSRSTADRLKSDLQQTESKILNLNAMMQQLAAEQKDQINLLRQTEQTYQSAENLSRQAELAFGKQAALEDDRKAVFEGKQAVSEADYQAALNAALAEKRDVEAASLAFLRGGGGGSVCRQNCRRSYYQNRFK